MTRHHKPKPPKSRGTFLDGDLVWGISAGLLAATLVFVALLAAP